MAKSHAGKLFVTARESQAAVDRFREAAEKFTRKATVSPETAREAMVKEGIYTKAGKLSRHYRD
ncbi:MAG: hypothetical protein K2X03_06485 [Bryobacteraceae bacterium]|nr:hypothetical protein [Bryobacteraceae bacterium]